MNDLINKSEKIIFISYSHDDKDFSDKLASMLLSYDLQIWRDSKDIRIGGNILKSIYEGIKNTSHFCCIISLSSIKSAWVEEELSYAKIRQLGDTSLEIVPILIDKVEIPDFLKAYRCAHLEDRDLSEENPEFSILLKTFGKKLKNDNIQVITGPNRIELLKFCSDFRDFLIQYREWIGRFQAAHEEYERARSKSKYIEVPYIDARRMGSSRMIRNPDYSDLEINRSIDNAVNSLKLLRRSGLQVVGSINRIKQFAETKGLKLPYIDSDLNTAASICETIAVEPSSEISEKHANNENASLTGLWWVREKLPRWIASLPRIEASVERCIGLLKDWGRFNPDV
jgi:hypothetical protein